MFLRRGVGKNVGVKGFSSHVVNAHVKLDCL